MRILGIETSCDETAAAVVEDGKQLLSNVVATSIDLHIAYGGVVPEIAARSHIESIMPVIQKALEDAQMTWGELDGVAVTYGAGLGGSLLIGVLAARTLAIIKKKPLYAINHVEGHVYANFLTSAGPRSHTSKQSSELHEHSLRDAALEAPLLSRSSISTASSATPFRLASHQSPTDVKRWQLGDHTYTLPSVAPTFPMLALIVSGGHSQLVLFRDHFDYTLLGQTQDDAIGEAFDKVAKMLGLPYPGGPSLEKFAAHGDPHAFKLPKAKMIGISPRISELRSQISDQNSVPSKIQAQRSKLPTNYDFSFSGVKTAVLRLAQAQIGEDFNFPSSKLSERLSEPQKANIAASFQRVAIETVVDKTLTAYKEFNPKSVVIGGGVAASPELRRQLSERLSISINYQDPKLMTDNGAMIATLGCYKAMLNQPPADPYTLDIAPNLSM